MNIEVDRYSSAWAYIALCADLTWATDQPDDFILANQRLWRHHCRVKQILRDTFDSQCGAANNNDLSDLGIVGIKENGTCTKRNVKDVIPESRLAQFYGSFYYDDIRENFYTHANDKTSSRFSSNDQENTDLTECWMLPEVEYWFRKLDESSDRVPRRRRQCKMLTEDELCKIDDNIAINMHRSAASERWGPIETSEEAALKAKIESVRNIWSQSIICRPRAPSPPPVSRKIRTRRRQTRKLPTPPISYCLEDAQFHCESTCKFDVPRSSNLTNYQRAIGRLSSSVQAFIRANNSKFPPYKTANINRYTPTGLRPIRYPERRLIWWPGKTVSPRAEKNINVSSHNVDNTLKMLTSDIDCKKDFKTRKEETLTNIETLSQTEKTVDDGEVPTTSNKAKEDVRKKRLYSTVLSMSAPPINLTPVIRLSQKLAPGLIKLNPKLSAKLRPSIDKFEELEKEALEQYKDSDESIDTKFRALEKQAEEQYSNSNSNTSCSSGSFRAKKSENKAKTEEHDGNFHGKISVDSVVIYSQNFPDLNAKQTKNIHLKNFHSPPRGEKREPRTGRSIRNTKGKSKRPASDTDYESKGVKEKHKSMRWTFPKKRHMILCVSNYSSDEDLDVLLKDAAANNKNHFPGKIKISAHGGGDLHPILNKP